MKTTDTQKMDLEDRIKRLEKHTLWLIKEEKNKSSDAYYATWQWLCALGMLVVIALFAALASLHRFHDLFWDWRFRDDANDTISIYNEEVESWAVYGVALALGFAVAFVDKIVVEPGQRVIHHDMVERNHAWFIKMVLYEASCVIMSMITTYFYFTNVLILGTVLVGRVAGAVCVAVFLHAPRSDSSVQGTGAASRLGFLAF